MQTTGKQDEGLITGPENEDASGSFSEPHRKPSSRADTDAQPSLA
jgi:hypothetical protein